MKIENTDEQSVMWIQALEPDDGTTHYVYSCSNKVENLNYAYLDWDESEPVRLLKPGDVAGDNPNYNDEFFDDRFDVSHYAAHARLYALEPKGVEGVGSGKQPISKDPQEILERLSGARDNVTGWTISDEGHRVFRMFTGFDSSDSWRSGVDKNGNHRLQRIFNWEFLRYSGRSLPFYSPLHLYALGNGNTVRVTFDFRRLVDVAGFETFAENCGWDHYE